MVSIKSKKVNYSQKESELLSLLPKDGKPITSIELTKRLKSTSYSAQQSTVALMSSLIRKAIHNKEPFRIEKAARSGPNPMEYRKIDK